MNDVFGYQGILLSVLGFSIMFIENKKLKNIDIFRNIFLKTSAFFFLLFIGFYSFISSSIESYVQYIYTYIYIYWITIWILYFYTSLIKPINGKWIYRLSLFLGIGCMLIGFIELIFPNQIILHNNGIPNVITGFSLLIFSNLFGENKSTLPK